MLHADDNGKEQPMPHQAFRKSLYLALILILGLGLAVLLQWALDTGPLPTVHAAQVGPITTTDDELTTDGDCSLREAIQAANTDAAVDACPAGSGGDTILLPAGTFTLTLAGAIEHNNATGDLDITDALTIVGAGPELTVIDANRLDRVLDVRPAAGTVVISGVTVMNGESVGFSSGGGINVWYANLVLTNVIVYGNRAGGSGGGIHVEHGDTTLYETRVVSNYAGSAGGGIHVYMSTLTMNGGEITSNTSEAAGGGICKAYEGPDPTLVLSNVQVIGNVTPVQGGGFCCGNATIYASQFMSNTAIDGAGAFAGATPGETMVLSKTVFMSNTAQNNGGGVWLYGGTVTLDEVQIIDNTAGLGSGGLYYGGSDATVEISDSTFRANGVGLYLQARDDRDGGNIAIHNSVISDNTAAGVVYSGTSPITITLGGAPGGANTFRRNGPDGKVNVLAGAPDTSPPIRAFYNDWGVAGLADVESTFYHHFDDASLARIDYYTLTLDTVPTSQLANGQAPVTVTAALTGLLDLLPGAVISFTADLGTLSAPTSTTDAGGHAWVTLTSTVAGTATITATAGIDPFASRPATATASFWDWLWSVYLPAVTRNQVVGK
jgi:CSLREA domain-containing protein